VSSLHYHSYTTFPTKSDGPRHPEGYPGSNTYPASSAQRRAGHGLEEFDLFAVLFDQEASVSTETIYSLEHVRRDFIWPKSARKLAAALDADSPEFLDD
jgi:hypothetical protein